jgi:phosphoribosylamine---glycine ligase
VKVLVVGGGAREHALAWKLKQEDPSLSLIAAPGNPGIAELGTCVPIGALDIDALAAFARREKIGLTVVGPEAPLAAGLVDLFRAEKLPIFGPTRAAAHIETSKSFSKQLMLDAGVPTARAMTFTHVERAKGAARELGAPVVIKASGLASGKGVIVCTTIEEADRAIDSMLVDHSFGVAGSEVLVEEYMAGEELSVFAITDGERVVPLIPSQDHKRLLDGDRGPNTGGMGAYAPVSIAPPMAEISNRILLPTLSALRARGTPFTGLLYAGLMLTDDGPKVVEFNGRFGDPETQAVLPIMQLSPTLLELFHAIARGEPLPDGVTVRATGHAVTTVIASAGYPEQPRSGDVIELPRAPDDVLVFHGGTKRRDGNAGPLVTSGGRVLAVTGIGGSLEQASRRSLDYASSVRFDGKQLRSDIGWRELTRPAVEERAGAA